ncbi:MAG: hypothetical protein GXO79_11655 [Chlorobi bacterium]|nr:hypothetical protein [Chlorobiota bacterium]
MKRVNITLLAIVFIIGISCEKEITNPNDTDDTSANSSGDIVGLEKWVNGNSKQLDILFVQESGVITEFYLPDNTATTYSFTKDGTVVTEIKQTTNGSTKTIKITYTGDVLTKIEGGTAEFTFEYDANNRIEQINKGTNTFYEFTYTGNNVTAIKKTYGTTVTNYILEYDSEPNPFYNDINMRVFTIEFLFNVAPYNWALDYLLTFNENNVTKISWDGKDYINTFYRTGSRIDSVIQVASWNTSSSTTYILKY